MICFRTKSTLFDNCMQVILTKSKHIGTRLRAFSRSMVYRAFQQDTIKLENRGIWGYLYDISSNTSLNQADIYCKYFTHHWQWNV